MSYPGSGPIQRHYRSCLMCGRPFPVRRCELRETNRGKFCTIACYAQSRLAFSNALRDGRLDAILAPEREQARRASAARVMDTQTSRRLITDKYNTTP
jgi:hypothetical protein